LCISIFFRTVSCLPPCNFVYFQHLYNNISGSGTFWGVLLTAQRRRPVKVPDPIWASGRVLSSDNFWTTETTWCILNQVGWDIFCKNWLALFGKQPTQSYRNETRVYVRFMWRWDGFQTSQTQWNKFCIDVFIPSNCARTDLFGWEGHNLMAIAGRITYIFMNYGRLWVQLILNYISLIPSTTLYDIAIHTVTLHVVRFFALLLFYFCTLSLACLHTSVCPYFC